MCLMKAIFITARKKRRKKNKLRDLFYLFLILIEANGKLTESPNIYSTHTHTYILFDHSIKHWGN